MSAFGKEKKGDEFLFTKQTFERATHPKDRAASLV